MNIQKYKRKLRKRLQSREGDVRCMEVIAPSKKLNTRYTFQLRTSMNYRKEQHAQT